MQALSHIKPLRVSEAQTKFVQLLEDFKIKPNSTDVKQIDDFLFTKYKVTYQSPSIRRSVCDVIASKLNIKTQHDWYQIKGRDMLNAGGSSIMEQCNSSLYKVLSNAYPEYEWFPWLFIRHPKTFWHKKSNQRKFCDWVATELNFSSVEDWYNLTFRGMCKLGGRPILLRYGASLSQVLKNVYPEFTWHPWLFRHMPLNYLNDPKTQRQVMDWLAEELDIQSVDDWLQCTNDMILEHGGGSILVKYKRSLLSALEETYPEFDWRTVSSGGEVQSKVINLLSTVIKDEIKVEHKMRVEGKKSVHVELDIYVPSLCLAIEYQGQQHYEQTYVGSYTLQAFRDTAKKKLCEQMGITLVEIPYWWDGSLNGLISSIQRIRPDLFQSYKYEKVK